MPAITIALAPRYRGAELIASGGMADVYVATDEMLERRVAIKALGERFADDPEIRLRFTREARIAARLSNEPNVVTIYDVADAGGRPDDRDGVSAREARSPTVRADGSLRPSRSRGSNRRGGPSTPPMRPASSTVTSSPRT